MAYTVQNIIDDVRERLVDLDDLSVDDSTMLSFVNQGQREIFSLTGIGQTTTTYTTGGGEDGTLALNDSVQLGPTTGHIIRALGIDYNDAKLSHANLEEMRTWIVASGTPSGWSQWGAIVYLDAIPSSGQTIRAWVMYIPEDNATTASELAEQAEFPDFRACLTAYVGYRCRAREQEGALADRARMEYESLLAAISQRYDLINNGGYPR